MTKLEREWAAKLRASGFRDLEGGDRDGPLSNAGNLHAIAETEHEHGRLAQRMEDGAAYQQAARDLLWARRWRSALDRRIWEMHVDGSGLREITSTLKVTWARAAGVLQECRARITQSNESTKGEFTGCESRVRMRSMIAKSDPRVLAKLAAVLARGLTLTPS